MRILLTSYPLYGHVNPMLPLALAAARAGHDVVFATGPDLAPEVARRGLTTWAVGPTHAAACAVTPPSPRLFTETAGPRAADLVARTATWVPDLVVADEFELAGAVVAGVHDARLVVHGLGPMLPAMVWALAEPAIAALHAGWGLPDGVAAVRGARYLEAMPPSLRPTSGRVWADAEPLRPVTGMPRPGERLPAALDALPFADTVHLTLGTMFHTRTAVLSAALEGLRSLDVNVVVTAGPDADLDAFGPQPAHVHLARYLPHGLLLPRCRLVVSQGGAGVLLGALARGLPQLLLPQGADQFINAEACVRAGAALSLAPDAVDAGAVRAAVRRLLDEAAFSSAARVVRAELEAMPDADAVVSSLVGAAVV